MVMSGLELETLALEAKELSHNHRPTFKLFFVFKYAKCIQ